MPIPIIIIGGVAIGSLLAGGYAMKQAERAGIAATKLTGIAAGAGVLYVSYRVLAKRGVI